jgi:hypothetical protein
VPVQAMQLGEEHRSPNEYSQKTEEDCKLEDKQRSTRLELLREGNEQRFFN